MSITPMISPNFKETGLDTQVLENMNAVTPSEDLSKALKKEGLVQKDVTVQGKNGTFTRKIVYFITYNISVLTLRH